MAKIIETFTLYYYGFDRNAVIEVFDTAAEITRRIDELKARGINFKESPVKRSYQTVKPGYDFIHEYRFEATDVFYSG